jgi:hypothetical protein
MASLNLLPDPTLLELISLTVDHETKAITAFAATRETEVACPLCQHTSHRVHSRYQRQRVDLPICGQSIRWVVQVRRFRCENPACRRKIFCERLPTCVPASARRTARATQVLTAIAFALGGRAGARLIEVLSMETSHDTLLRLIRRQPEVATPPVQMLGVDEMKVFEASDVWESEFRSPSSACFAFINGFFMIIKSASDPAKGVQSRERFKSTFFCPSLPSCSSLLSSILPMLLFFCPALSAGHFFQKGHTYGSSRFPRVFATPPFL